MNEIELMKECRSVLSRLRSICRKDAPFAAEETLKLLAKLDAYIASGGTENLIRDERRAERERCAAQCERRAESGGAMASMARQCAADIRALPDEETK